MSTTAETQHIESAGATEPVDTAAKSGLPDSRGISHPSAMSGMLWMLSLVLFVRLTVFLVGVESAATATPQDLNDRYTQGQAWIAFDAIKYARLAREGYPAEGIPSSIAFFPLLPLLAAALRGLMSTEVAVVLIANLATLVGSAFLYAWCRRLTNHRVSLLCCLLLATFPAAAFFSAGITEGPFFCGVAIVLFLLQRGNLWLAAVICGIATALRPTGVALAAIVVLWTGWTMLRRHPSCKRFSPAGISRLAALALLSVTGILLYQSYLWTSYGRFDAYFQAQSYWQPGGLKTEKDRAILAEVAERQKTEVRDARYYLGRAMTPSAWNRGMMLAVLGVTVWGLIRPGPIPRVLFLLPLAIFLMAYLPGWGARASSIARFQTAALPCFALLAIGLARWTRPGVIGVVLAAQFSLQLYYAWLFSRGTWIG